MEEVSSRRKRAAVIVACCAGESVAGLGMVTAMSLQGGKMKKSTKKNSKAGL